MKRTLNSVAHKKIRPFNWKPASGRVKCGFEHINVCTVVLLREYLCWWVELSGAGSIPIWYREKIGLVEIQLSMHVFGLFSLELSRIEFFSFFRLPFSLYLLFPSLIRCIYRKNCMKRFRSAYTNDVCMFSLLFYSYSIQWCWLDWILILERGSKTTPGDFSRFLSFWGFFD